MIQDLHALDAAGLGHDLSSEGSGADDSDLDRTPLSPLSQSSMKHPGFLFSRPTAISGARPRSGPLPVEASRRKRSGPACCSGIGSWAASSGDLPLQSAVRPA